MARRGLAAFERVRRDLPVDLVLLEGPARLERLTGGRPPEAVGAVVALRDALHRAREARLPGCALSPPRPGDRGVGDPLADACDLVRQGVLDAVLLLGAPPATPRLRLRRGARVVEPAPGRRADLGRRLAPEPLTDALAQAARALRGLGLARPRLVVLRPDGDDDEVARLEQALARARAQGRGGPSWEVVGPLPEAAAVVDRGDALVALVGAHAELALALLGAGSTTTLLLEPGLRSACAEPDEAGLRAALEHLVTWSRAEGPLAAARAPTVSVTRAVAGAAGRCPFCRRALDESPAGELLAPGPPLVCVKCGTAHHRDCLAEHGRCTLLGCDAARVVRLGVSLPLLGLGSEAPARHPFHDVGPGAAVGLDGKAGGDAAGGVLRVEAPIDDATARVERRRVTLELGAAGARRGELVEGFVALWTGRPARVRGGLLRVRATLTTRDLADPGTPPRVQAIVSRQAALVGDRPTGAFGRLQDGVASFFGAPGAATGGLTIPAGCRRWPFSFRLPQDHPGSVRNRRGSLEELVETTLEVVLDTDTASATLEVS